jgi:hypothetical protein
MDVFTDDTEQPFFFEAPSPKDEDMNLYSDKR